ncbi:hypothetical protein AB8879_10630 [Alphaproteobacteria bacterium LSUCC0744]
MVNPEVFQSHAGIFHKPLLKNNAMREPRDVVLMFELLTLHSFCKLSNIQVKFQGLD